MRYFYRKFVKITHASGLPSLLRMRNLPQSTAAEGFAPRFPIACGGWGLSFRPLPIPYPPIENFWLRHRGEELKILESDREELGKTLQTTVLVDGGHREL